MQDPAGRDGSRQTPNARRRGASRTLALLLALCPGCHIIELLVDDALEGFPITQGGFYAGTFVTGLPASLLALPVTAFLEPSPPGFGAIHPILHPGYAVGWPAGVLTALPVFVLEALVVKGPAALLERRFERPRPGPASSPSRPSPCTACSRTAPCLCTWPAPRPGASTRTHLCSCFEPVPDPEWTCLTCGGPLPPKDAPIESIFEETETGLRIIRTPGR